MLYIGMYLLADTADTYLSPSLDTIVTRFKVQESLAGVTLLAFGNGAPDVFSNIAAVLGQEDSPNATVSLSILLGGTYFITCVVVSLSTFASNLNEDPNGKPIRQIKVTPKLFVRDIVFFMFITVYLLLIFLIAGEFNIYTSVGLLLIYAIYVIMVVIQSKDDDPQEDQSPPHQKMISVE
jgi:sodium/potassium/calcium exchanger 6